MLTVYCFHCTVIINFQENKAGKIQEDQSARVGGEMSELWKPRSRVAKMSRNDILAAFRLRQMSDKKRRENQMSRQATAAAKAAEADMDEE